MNTSGEMRPMLSSSSIRDSGSFLDVLTNAVEEQNEYKQLVKGCDPIIMLVSMLHSIAVGYLLPKLSQKWFA